MKKILDTTMIVFWTFLSGGCQKTNDGGGSTPPISLPKFTISDAAIVEGNDNNTTLDFTISLEGAFEGVAAVNYQTDDATAFQGLDYVPLSGTLSFTYPDAEKTVQVQVIGDDQREGQEFFRLSLSQPTNATLSRSVAKGIIRNDDTAVNLGAEGYTTPAHYEGWKLKWADEFEGDSLNTDDWTFELGNGCAAGLCGWGNQELENYSDESKNLRLENGNLILEAVEDIPGAFTSARIKTQGKQIFQFGRIDIRARLPKGQGIWPALWMLGTNITEVGWPASGEIDIMEMIGSEPKTVHSTVHFGPNFAEHRQAGIAFISAEEFIERFHVFSLVWEKDNLWFFVDDVLFLEITPGNTAGVSYPFNNTFFFIFNLAVGGNWPGPPDETTLFPQRMVVDYIRVFQKE